MSDLTRYLIRQEIPELGDLLNAPSQEDTRLTPADRFLEEDRTIHEPLEYRPVDGLVNNES